MTQTPKPSALDARLQRLLGGPERAALRLRLRRYFERRDPAADDGVLSLSRLSAFELEALAQLTGRSARPSHAADLHACRIDIPALNALLHSAGVASSLREALERLDGPIGNPAADKQALQSRWAQTHSAVRAHPALAAWLQEPAAISLLKRLARQDPDVASALLVRAQAVLQRLPAQGLTRAQLAADTMGNAHALDNGQALATLVLAVLQTAGPSVQNADLSTDALAGQASAGDATASADRARDIWARAGVLVNELARPALFLNLPTHASDPFQPMAGEPGFLSLRQLLQRPIQWHVTGATVYVCENPNIVSIAADRLGANCAPLVCTDGMPAAAQRVLLMQLAQAGAKLRYHGDFDWAGLQIANQVIQLCGAQPWRMGHTDYTQAVQTAPHTQRDLADSQTSAAWDAALAPAMRQHGLAIAEEAVVASLLIDLYSGGA